VWPNLYRSNLVLQKMKNMAIRENETTSQWNLWPSLLVSHTCSGNIIGLALTTRGHLPPFDSSVSCAANYVHLLHLPFQSLEETA
jgi:hypothetical protein